MDETNRTKAGQLVAKETGEFFERAPLGMARVWPDGRFMQVNPSLCEMLGYSRDELLELKTWDLSHPGDFATSRDFIDRVIEGTPDSTSLEKRYLRKDGSLLYALVSTTPVRDEHGAPLYFLTHIIDIGKQHRREEIQDAHTHVLKMIAMHRPLHKVLEEIVRRAEAQNPDVRASVLLLSRERNVLLHGAAPSLPNDYNAIINGLRIGVGVGSCGTAAATGERVVVEDVRKHPYWELFQEAVDIGSFGACWSEPILDADDQVLGTFAMYYREPRAPEPADLEFIESTARLAGIAIARRYAEDAMSQSEENLRITLDSIDDAVIATDAHGLVTRLNPVAEVLTGWTSEEARERPLTEVFQVVDADTSEPVDLLAKALRQSTVTGQVKGPLLTPRDGTPRRIADSGAPIRDRQGQVVGTVLVFRDVSVEHDLQEQLRQAQKMEAIGQLAGGVAHDFNNILTGILGHAGLLSMSLDEGSDEKELVEHIIQSSKRAADLTKQLLAFSRKGRLRTTGVELHSLVDEVVQLLSRIIDKRIVVKEELHAERSTVLGDPSQLQHAILNLGVNARDAMPEGGELAIRTRNVCLDQDYCAAQGHQVSPGDYVELCVDDTGIGMSPETLERIFEPFFTTKAPGKGTGLGLAGVYGTVKSHGGLIRVESDPNKGARFRILLPTGQPKTSKPTTLAPAASLHRTQGRVLIVDDEETVRDSAARYLRRLGYTVTTCEDGVKAVELFEAGSRDFDLVILDLMMPKLNGLDTFRRMKRVHPEVRVLVSSGFSRDQTVDTMLEEGALGFLMKPFLLEELASEVARTCGASLGDGRSEESLADL